MRRHIKILEYALSSLVRRKYKNLAILLVYTFTIMLLASILFLTHALKQEASFLLLDAPDLVVQKMAAGRHDLIPVQYARAVEKIRGVKKASPRHWGYYYDALTRSNYTVLGIDTGMPGLHLVEGSLPSDKGQCAIGTGVAAVRSVGVGDELIIVDSHNTGTAYEITGTFSAQSNLLTYDLVVLTRGELMRFFGLPADRATDIAVEVHNEREVPTIAAKIRQVLPDTRPITKNEIIRTYDAVFNWRSGMMLVIFSSALIAFCILAWDKATGISAEEKREIGILKAIGWDTSDILELKFWEGAALSLTSFLLGSIAAYVHVFFFSASLLAPVIKGWSVLFPEFRLTPSIDFYQITVMGFLTVVPYIASTIVPSWKAAITDPESVMRT
ncbi:MAG: ABC transporter permease [Nitrospirota bacterium]